MDSGVCDEDAAEGPQYRPPAGAAQGRGVRSRPVGPVAAIDGAVGQQYPAGGKVAGRITRAEIAEVDHAAECAVRGEDVSRVQVPVEPQRRACPAWRSDRVVPDRANGVRVGNQPQIGGLGEVAGEAFREVGQSSAPAPAGRRPGRGGLVQGRQEGGQGIGRLRAARGGGTVGGLAQDPGSNDPRPGKSLGGFAEALRDWDRQGQARGEGGQPGVLLAQQRICGPRRPGQPDGEVAAEPPQLVVPAARAELQGAIGQVGVLVAQQIPDQLRRDLELGVGHPGNASRCAMVPRHTRSTVPQTASRFLGLPTGRTGQ